MKNLFKILLPLATICFFSLLSHAAPASWFVSDPMRQVRSISEENALAILKSTDEFEENGGTSEYNDAREMVSKIYNAFNKEFPELIKNKQMPLIMISQVKGYYSPASITYEDAGFIFYPLDLWRNQSEGGKVSAIAHEMVHYFLHGYGQNQVIWMKDGKGKIYDHRASQTQRLELLLDLFTTFNFAPKVDLGIFSSSVLVQEFLDTLLKLPVQYSCGLNMIDESKKAFTLMLNEVRLDQTNGRVLSESIPFTAKTKANNILNKWKNCLDRMLEMNVVSSWVPKFFPSLDLLINQVEPETLSYQLEKNPITLAERLLRKLNSNFETLLEEMMVDYSSLNYYTIEDQADELSAIVLQNQNINFSRRTLLEVASLFDSKENVDFCLESLKSSKPIPRSNSVVRTHRSTCARVQRLETYTKSLKAYPQSEGF